MSRNLTPEEVKQNYIDKMGLEIGELFNALWQDVVRLHVKWEEYVQLFGTKKSRVDLLNSSAPQSFTIYQELLWDGILLHICRLTDPPKSAGKKNLTIRRIPELILDQEIKLKTIKLVHIAEEKSEFCRDWRNRHIAHNDYNLALNSAVEPLAPASRNKVIEAIESIAEVLNCVSSHYDDSTSNFGLTLLTGGANSLLHVLYEGLKSRDDKYKRWNNDEYREDDLEKPDI